MSLNKIWLVILVLLPLNAIWAQSFIRLENQKSYPLSGDFISIFEDKTGKLELKDILSTHKDSFKINSADYAYNENYNSSYWIKFKYKNLSGPDIKYIFESYELHTDELQLYTQVSEGFEVYKVGRNLNFKDRKYQNKNFIFDLPASDTSKVYTAYVNVKSSDFSGFEFFIRTQEYFTNYSTNEYYLLGIYYGILLIMAVYNLLLFISIREKVYLFYVLYVIGCILVSLTEDGLGYQYLWADSPDINKPVQYIIVPLLFLTFFVLYAQHYLELKLRFPRLYQLLWIVTLIFYIQFLDSKLKTYFLSFLPDVYIIPFVTLFIVTIYTLVKGSRPSKIFLLAYFPIFISIFIIQLRNYNFIESNLFTVYSFNFGIIWEVCVLSFALGDRMRTYKNDVIIELQMNEELKDSLIRQLKENEKLKDKINTELEQKVAERTKELAEKNMELDAFVYKASHDIKGPLRSIMGLTTIGMKDVQDAKAHNYFEHIYSSTEKLDALLKDLLGIAKMNQQKITIVSVNFCDIINEVLDSFKHVPNYSLIKFNIQIDQQGEFMSDKNLLHSIVQNLIENPIKYMDLSKTEHWLNIVIRTSSTGATLSFEDNGMGIKSEHQNKIFDMFYKVNEGSNGSGLGLYLVKLAVEKLRGRITLKSEEGKGSEFKVFIPFSKQG